MPDLSTSLLQSSNDMFEKNLHQIIKKVLRLILRELKIATSFGLYIPK